MVIGIAITWRHTDIFARGLAVSPWGNGELEGHTDLVEQARELAMERMQKEAELLQAQGIVGVQLSQLNHTWGSHTTEFFAIGTAVRPIRDDHPIPDPYLVLGLDT
ncbi:heavy metal-binding domain-containing protein [Kibdelosporangium aridum]|uniref:heavy metal-binding domain-containing protein n=1 Tax=Kibdelosporangium aridum TaxID=2030 RepID=UPI0035E89A10